MADPIGISIALDADTLADDPVWTRLDEPGADYGVTGWDVQRGRSSEFNRIDAATPTLNIVDRGGYYDPTNPGSPFYDAMAGDTKLDPMKQVAVCLWNPITDTWHPRFTGFASDLQYEMDVTGKFGTVTLDLADGFDLFGAIKLAPGQHGDALPPGVEGVVYYAEDAALTACQTRINKLLDDAGWSSAPTKREVYTGNVGLQASTYSSSDFLSGALLDVADAEFPDVSTTFFDASGKFIFHGRFRRFNPEDVAYHVRRWKAGDGLTAAADSTIAPITGLAFRRSKEDLINAAIALPANVSEFDVPSSLVKDDASIAKYGWRSIDFPDLQTRNGDGTTAVQETKKYATYYVENYKTPRTRITELRFRPRSPEHFSSPALWALICGVEIGDIIDLTTVHPRGGGFAEDLFVENIGLALAPGRVDPSNGEQELPDLELVLAVSPRAYYTTFNPFS